MRPGRLLLVPAILLTLVAARPRAVQPPAGWIGHSAPSDVFSHAEPSKVTTKAIALDLTVDFERRQLRGTARLEIENLSGTDTLILDTESLAVSSVVLNDALPADWSFGPLSSWGTPLRITIGPETRSVTIAYETSPSASGLLWNTAEQSFGRQQPYLYSQNEPVSARSWIPSQDTPTVRSTYTATLRVPPGLLALMSAGNNPTSPNELGIYTFDMPYRVPSYLIALAVGRLEFRSLGAGSGVYAEPELIEDAVHELSYVPAMMRAAEEIAGPYPFDRYDLLLAPPTYIAGGMEHPMLNFIHPFSVAGQNEPPFVEPKTLIAHELAHSWAGDSATLANWNDVWLNEGITNYLSYRIMEEVAGSERAELLWFYDRRAYEAYAASVTDPSDTLMHRAVPHPFTGFGPTGYIKGGLFIRTLEDLVGREKFDSFLARYFGAFAYRWVDAVAFLDFLRGAFPDEALQQRLQLDDWIYGPGLPANLTAPTTSVVYERAVSRTQQFASGAAISTLAPASWREYELDLFLQLAGPSIRTRMAEVDAAFGLSLRTTAPTTWLLHAIATGYAPSNGAIERALARGGPNGTIPALYNALIQAPGGRTRAAAFFAKYRGRYVDWVEGQIETMLNTPSATATMREAA